VTTFAEKVVALDRALSRDRVPHAFGGALALAYCVGEPRATADIDVNIFVRVDEVSGLFASLPEDIVVDDTAAEAVTRDGQVRLWWDDTPVDLFFSYHPLHDRAQARISVVPFGSDEIPVLSCTDLAVFKVVFNRTRDWADLEAMIEADSVDRDEALRWLGDTLGEDAKPVQRFAELEARDDQGLDALRNALGTPDIPARGASGSA
jgi:hypothetical protein